jgi:hypothetical protein
MKLKLALKDIKADYAVTEPEGLTTAFFGYPHSIFRMAMMMPMIHGLTGVLALLYM